MVYNLLKVVKTNKPHKCVCGAVIPKGQRVHFFKGSQSIQGALVISHKPEYFCGKCRPIQTVASNLSKTEAKE